SYLFRNVVCNTGIHLIDMIIQYHQLSIYHGQIILNGVHNISKKIFCHKIIVIFIENTMIDFSPKYIDQGFYLKFKIDTTFNILIIAINFINAKAISLRLWLYLI